MKRAAWSFAHTFLSKGFSFLFSIIIGNLLLPDNLGLVVTIILIVTYMASIFSMNLGGGVIQKINDRKEKERASQYFSAGLVLTLILTFVAIVVFYLLRNPVMQVFNISMEKEIYYLALPLLFFTMQRSYLNHVLQARMQFKTLALINISAAAVQMLVTLLLLLSGMGVKGVFFGMYSGGMVAVLPHFYINIRYYGLSLDGETIKSLKSLAAFSSVIFVGSIAVLLDQRIDMLFVAHFLDNEHVALYNYALKFSLLFILFGQSISRITYPKFTRAFTLQTPKNINKLFAFAVNFTFFFLTIISLIFLFNSKWIINLILPEFYVKIIPFLLILFIGIVPKAVVSSVGTLFTAKGTPSVSAKINWSLLAVNVVLNILLIPKYGLMGAAVATTTSFFLKPIIMFFLISRKVQLEYPFNNLIIHFIIYIGLMVSGYHINNYLIRELLVISYGIYCYSSFLNREERQYLQLNLNRFNHKMLKFIRQ
jgi:O-antigen/teichoic acid export membrane protein